MNRIIPILVFLLWTASLIGCVQPEPVIPPEERVERPPIAAEPYTGPAPRVTVRRSTLGRTTDVRITVPTGGHRLAINEADVHQGELLLFVTLMRPAREEVVTMAYETLGVTHETDRRFDFVRVYVRTHRRGESRPREYQYAGQFAAAE